MSSQAAPYSRVFSADQTLARFAVAMAIASNDVEHAVRNAGQANSDGGPEFS